MRGYIILVVVLAAVLPVVVGLLAVFGATPVEETGERDEQLARVTTWLLMRDLASTPRVFALGTDLFDLPTLPDEEKIGVLRMLYKQDEDVDVVVLLDELGQTVVEPVYLREEQVKPGTGTAHRLPANEEDIGLFLKHLPLETAQENGRAFSGVYINRRKNVAMVAGAVAVALNVVLDPVFMFDRVPIPGLDWIPGFGLGIGGAALATVLSATIAVGIGLYVLAAGKSNITVPMWRRFHPRVGIMLQILGIGGPAGLNSIMRSMAHWFVTTLVATFGTVVVASYGLALRIMELGILFGVGLNLGVSAMVGQNLGANKKDRAHEAVVKATLLVMGITAVLGAVEFGFARQILGFFTRR